MSDREAHEKALLRWLEALNARGRREVVDVAVDPAIRLERYGFGPNQGQLVQIIEGIGPLAAWLALTPENTAFEAVGDLDISDDGVGTSRYRVTFPPDFENGGEWRWRLAADGRLVFVSHRPSEIPQAIVERMMTNPPPMKPNKLAIEAMQSGGHAHDHGPPAGDDDSA